MGVAGRGPGTRRRARQAVAARASWPDAGAVRAAVADPAPAAQPVPGRLRVHPVAADGTPSTCRPRRLRRPAELRQRPDARRSSGRPRSSRWSSPSSACSASWLVGLALALLLRTRIPASGMFKVLLLLPWVVPVVVSSTSWNWLVATPQSPMPVLARGLGLRQRALPGRPARSRRSWSASSRSGSASRS